MRKSIPFYKYTGLGNDFIIFNCLESDSLLIDKLSSSELVQSLCDRHFGIGADGVVLLRKSSSPHPCFAMTIVNSDGSEAEMCGNAIRCLARFIIDFKLTHESFYSGEETGLSINTLSGIINVALLEDKLFSVDMGKPILNPCDIPTLFEVRSNSLPEGTVLIDNQTLPAYSVGMGNPHLIIPVGNLESIDYLSFGSLLENHPLFPAKTNVHFLQVIHKNHLKVLVWERGVGSTLACGTGACASLVAANLLGLSSTTATVSLPGGDLRIDWPSIHSNVIMTGPASAVFNGSITI